MDTDIMQWCPQIRSGVLGLMTTVLTSTIAPAQCGLAWMPGDGLPGADARVEALVEWDVDGPGGRPPQLVVGGAFGYIGHVEAPGIALFDPGTRTWSSPSPGYPLGPTYARCFAVTAGNELLVGGTYYVYRYDGVAWVSLGAPHSSSSVTSLVTGPGGQVFAGTQTDGVWEWTGSAWVAMGSGWSGIDALACSAQGVLVAAGGYQSGSTSQHSLRSWSPGTRTWGTVPLPQVGHSVRALAFAPNGRLTAAGAWPGAVSQQSPQGTWSLLGGGQGNDMGSGLSVTPGGDVLLSVGSRVVRWNGLMWQTLAANGAGPVLLQCSNGTVFVGGRWRAFEGLAVRNLVQYSAGSWSSVGGGFDEWPYALAQAGDGSVYVGGGFGHAGEVPARFLARRIGGVWTRLPMEPNGIVLSIAAMPGGDVVVSGDFTLLQGPSPVAADRIARWTGAQWVPLGTGLDSPASKLLQLRNGGLLACGSIRSAGGTAVANVAMWTGNSWIALGGGVGSGFFDYASAAGQMLNGHIVVGGSFQVAGGAAASNVAVWDGSAWSPLGGGVNGVVSDLLVHPDGGIIVGGQFSSAGSSPAACIARWDGSSWRPLGSGLNGGVSSLQLLPGGDVAVAGDFTMAGGVPVTGLARWDGAVWRRLGADFWAPQGVRVRQLLRLDDGDLLAAGDFFKAGGQSAAYLAQLTTTCSPAVASIPTACSGPAGPVSLVAHSQPWTGEVFESQAMGLASTSIAFVVLGLGSPQMPLSQVTPWALPGCDLLASPDSVQLLLPVGGTVTSRLRIPPGISLAGWRLYQQVLQFNVASPESVSSSNGLTLTLGAF